MPDQPGYLDEPCTMAELAQETGVSHTTISNWTKRDNPLPSVETPDGAPRYTRQDLRDFCNRNPKLGAAKKVLQALRGRRESTSIHIVEGEAAREIESLKALARDLRTAAHHNLQAALIATRQVEEAARSHREQLEHLTTSLAAYDDALTELTAPSSMND